MITFKPPLSGLIYLCTGITILICGCSSVSVKEETYYYSPYLLPNSDRILLLRNDYKHESGLSMIYVHTDNVISSKWYLQIYNFSGILQQSIFLKTLGDTSGTNAWVDGKKNYSVLSATDSAAIIGFEDSTIVLFDLRNNNYKSVIGDFSYGSLKSNGHEFIFLKNKVLWNFDFATSTQSKLFDLSNYNRISRSMNSDNTYIGLRDYNLIGLYLLNEHRIISFNKLSVSDVFCFGSNRLAMQINNDLQIYTIRNDSLFSDTTILYNKPISDCTFHHTKPYVCYIVEQYRDTRTGNPPRYDIVLENYSNGQKTVICKDFEQ